MTADTGSFRDEGDEFITTVEGAWNKIYRGTEQVRCFHIDGNRLHIKIPEEASTIVPVS